MAVIHNEADFLQTSGIDPALADPAGVYHLQCTGTDQAYSKEVDLLGDRNFQVEAVLSAEALATGVERGARFWACFAAPDFGPDQVYCAEVRLAVVGGVARVELHDSPTSTVAQTSLNLDWADTADRFRVRIMRQDQGIYLEAERSSGWDVPTNPTAQSVSVPLAPFSHATGTCAVGFGNKYLGEDYASDWVSIHVTFADDLVTPMPYWPAEPDPAAVTSEPAAPQTVYLDCDMSGGNYLASDRAVPKLRELGSGTLREGLAIDDPGNISYNPIHVTFPAVDDFQVVEGWFEIRDACGRTTATAKGTCTIPDCVAPTAVVLIHTNLGEAPPKDVYGGSEVPDAVIVDVTEKDLNKGASYVQLGTTKTYFTGLSNRYTVPIAPVQDGNVLDVYLVDNAGHTWSYHWPFRFDSVAPTGRMQYCTGVPTDDAAWKNLVPGAAANGAVYVGVVLTNLSIDDLSFNGPWGSHLNVDGVVRLLDTTDPTVGGFSEKTVLGEPGATRIWWNTQLTLEKTYTVSFRLEDTAGNVTVLGPVSLDLDITPPNGKLQARATSTDSWKDLPAEFATPPSEICVAVPLSVDDLDVASSYLLVNGVNTAFPAGVADAQYTRYLFSGAITTDGLHAVTAHLEDLATNEAEVSSSVGVGKPNFYFEGNRYNTENAALISHTSTEGSDNDPQGLLLTGAASNNYMAVRVRNGGFVAGDLKFRIFAVPACLFTGTAQWRLVHHGVPGSIAAMAPGSQTSKGNANFNDGHPNFPGASDPLWAAHASGDLLHACACAVLHSPADPLKLPDGAGNLVPVSDADFEDPTAFASVVMGRIDSYSGGTGKYWEAVGDNPKIANRNINVKKVGV